MTSRRIDYAERGAVTIFADSDALALTAAKILAATVAEAASARRPALIALSGGSTPQRMGQMLAGEPFLSEVDWSMIAVFWGDERAVPLEDDQSNAGTAIRGFLTTAGVPENRLHLWDATNPDLDAAAAAYADDLRRAANTGGTPRFDLVFLGMGDDGHTLSLFPDTAALAESVRLAVANRVDKLNATRLTLTAPVVNQAQRVVFLVGGAGKADVLHAVLDGDVDVTTYPSQIIRPVDGTLTWLIDEAAAARLDRA